LCLYNNLSGCMAKRWCKQKRSEKWLGSNQKEKSNNFFINKESKKVGVVGGKVKLIGEDFCKVVLHQPNFTPKPDNWYFAYQNPWQASICHCFTQMGIDKILTRGLKNLLSRRQHYRISQFWNLVSVPFLNIYFHAILM